ncbi:hypothetical protein [Nocardioides sp.]|uniref:hypothetical protein n=1 Tax=Nocardioides sp. TaxID=35761 RepID=UPI003512866E
MTVPPPRPRRHRIAALAVALTAIVASTAAATAAPARVAAAPTLAALPGSVDSGADVRLSGTAPRGAVVTLQARRSTTWTTLGTSRASSRGTWKATVRFTSGGTVRVRAVAAGRPSGIRAVDVYQWLRLSAQPFVTRAQRSRVGPVVVGGRRYPAALSLTDASNAASTYWALDRRCTDLRYSIGLLDSERARATGTELGASKVYGLRPDGGLAVVGPAFAADWKQNRVSTWTQTGLAAADRLNLTTRIIADGAISGSRAAAATLSMTVVSARIRCRAAALAPLSPARVP